MTFYHELRSPDLTGRILDGAQTDFDPGLEACLAYGIAPPEFSEQAGVVTVTFSAAVGPEEAEGPSWHQAGTK